MMASAAVLALAVSAALTTAALIWATRASLFASAAGGTFRPLALATAARWAAISSAVGTPGPAISTMKAIFGSAAATIGAIIPPSEWPTRPT